MLRKKTSAIKYNKNYNPKIEYMGWGVAGRGGGCQIESCEEQHTYDAKGTIK